jgi:hypothetical protein
MARSPVRRVNAGLVWVEAPGDYATPNSNQLRDGTASMTMLKVTNQASGKDFYVNPDAVVLAEPGARDGHFTVTVQVGSEDKRFQLSIADVERLSAHSECRAIAGDRHEN